MTTTKKPAMRPVQKSVAAGGVPPILAHSELALLAAYRAIDDETQGEMLGAMQNVAREFPRGPRLRLVAASRA